jgi:hypothetical protein
LCSRQKMDTNLFLASDMGDNRGWYRWNELCMRVGIIFVHEVA